MTVDLAPLVQGAVAFAAALLPVIAAAASAFTIRYFHLQNNAVLSGQITDAASRGAGLAYQFISQNAGAVSTVELRNVAVAKGVNYVVQSLPTALKSLGVTPDHVAEMVHGELGKLMAADPTVSIAPPAPNATPAPTLTPVAAQPAA